MKARPLVPGAALGDLLVLEEPLSFWGGFDSSTGAIIDRRHPQAGVVLTGSVVLMTSGRGSSSSSSVLAEAIRAGTAPGAILLGELDEIMVLGALVAEELYGKAMAVMLLDAHDYEQLRQGVSARRVRIAPDGGIQLLSAE